MKEGANAGLARQLQCATLTAAVAILLCLPLSSFAGQHANHAAPHAQPNRAQTARPAQQQKPENHTQPRPQYEPYRGAQNPQYQGAAPQNNLRPAPVNPSTGVRPAFPNTTYQGQGYAPRPAYPGAPQQPGYAPPGHLGAWLNEHRNAPPQMQQRMLQSDPAFNHLSPADQQRLVRQLNRVDQMPEAQRQRTLARAENLERLSPEERAQVRESGRLWKTLPADRQALMKSAFRSVPQDQRQTVLNSARYQNAFSPEERGILTNMLSVEPYEPPK
jgi:hypothetical protein